MVRTSSVATGQPARVRLIALKSENVYAVTNYRINGGSLSYVLASGGTGSVDLTEVDWRGASPLQAGPVSAIPNNGHTHRSDPVKEAILPSQKKCAPPPPHPLIRDGGSAGVGGCRVSR